MGMKLGCTVLDTPEAKLPKLWKAAAAVAALRGVPEVDLWVRTKVPVVPDAAPMTLAVFRAPGAGVDDFAEECVRALDVSVTCLFVNDFYQAGGFQRWRTGVQIEMLGGETRVVTQRNALLIDGHVTLGGQRYGYGAIPSLALGIETDFWALVNEEEGTDYRVVEEGEALASPRVLPPFEGIEWAWNSAAMTWPMTEGVARRQLLRER
ncbi:MAG: hypothetical protein AAGE52_14220 [Myxococcota bacterium]